MSQPKYRISHAAIQDLEAIWQYTQKNWSIEQADRYYRLIIGEIEFVAENPEAGKSYEQFKKGYRASKVKSHLLFYRKIESEPIEVIRILHQRMDLKARLK
jgi:toxin ParE1/3/4